MQDRFGSISLFNVISTFVDNLMPKQSFFEEHQFYYRH